VTESNPVFNGSKEIVKTTMTHRNSLKTDLIFKLSSLMILMVVLFSRTLLIYWN
jgi:hypothetical protein